MCIRDSHNKLPLYLIHVVDHVIDSYQCLDTVSQSSADVGTHRRERSFSIIVRLSVFMVSISVSVN